MKIRSNVIKTEFNNIGSFSRVNLFKSQCMSMYGIELYNLDSNEINKFLTAWRVCARKIINVNPRTHCNLIAPLMNCKNPLIIIEERMINFYVKLINHDNSLLKYIANFSLNNNFSDFTKNIFQILNKNSISFEKLFKKERIRIKENFQHDWRIDVLKELINMRDELVVSNLNLHEINNLIKYLCIE